MVIFKSDSHMSQDGPQLPNIDVWRQIIQEVRPELVITTGTAGGIGKQFEVGDVIVSSIVRFDCIAKFKKEPFAQAHYSSAPAKTAHFATARSLFKANASQLPKDNKRLPKIVSVGAEGAAFISRHDRLFRLRYVGQPLQAARAWGRFRNGRCGARIGCQRDGQRALRAGSRSATSLTRRSRPTA